MSRQLLACASCVACDSPRAEMEIPPLLLRFDRVHRVFSTKHDDLGYNMDLDGVVYDRSMSTTKRVDWNAVLDGIDVNDHLDRIDVNYLLQKVNMDELIGAHSNLAQIMAQAIVARSLYGDT
jgi:hypothetical protein